MKEIFLHFVWQHQLFDANLLKTIDGDSIEVINIGTYNTNAGPDFTNARLKIGNTIWAGDVEIHIRSQDWKTHKHNINPQYNSVILHLCYEGDYIAQNTNGTNIPTAIICIKKDVLQAYERLEKFPQTTVCFPEILQIDTFTQNMWFDRLVVERFEEKSNRILQIFENTLQNWEETLYVNLAYSFGLKVNSEAFTNLAKSLPYSLLLKHKSNLFQLEALLFGQANLLSDDDEYSQKLQKEYAFLQHKYSLQPIEKEQWKFSKLRPPNFPTVRIAQFAEFIFRNSNLCSQILESQSLNEIQQIFKIDLHEYWLTHYILGKESVKRKKQLGEQAINLIIINAIIPFLFSYGIYNSSEKHKEFALDLLEKLPSEKNNYIESWEEIGIQSHSAFRSQALIQLSENYCKKKRCLQCRFGQLFVASIKKSM